MINFLQKMETAPAKNVEVLMAGYFSEYRILYVHVGHLLGNEQASPDSNIAKRLNFKGATLSYVIQDGIALQDKLI